MKNIVSQQDLLEKIVSISKEVFEKTLALNPNEFTYDDERLDRHFIVQTQEFKCHIHRYEEKNPYYTIWFDLFYNINPGFNGFLIIQNAWGNANFYINDGDYGREDDYDENKVNECFWVIYNALAELII